MVWIISASNSHPRAFYGYGMQLFKSDGYVCGYGLCKYLTDMVADMILLSSGGCGLSAIFCGLSDLIN
jgi:hypothetical protein